MGKIRLKLPIQFLPQIKKKMPIQFCIIKIQNARGNTVLMKYKSRKRIRDKREKIIPKMGKKRFSCLKHVTGD